MADSNQSPRQPFVFEDLRIDPAIGLKDEQQVQEMRAKYGANALTPPQRDPWWKLLLEKFNDLTIQILLIAALISLAMAGIERYVLGNQEASFYDSIGIFLAVFLATGVGYLSEQKSAREFELLNEVKEDISVKVVRGGVFQTVGIKDLVVGDVIRVDMGDKVPADGVIIDTQGIYIDEAMLTGESVPAEKKAFTGSNLQEAEEDNRVAKGTMITDGHAQVIVTAVGDATKMGEIARKLAESDAETGGEEETPLKQKLARLAKLISVVGISSATVIFVVMGVEALIKSQIMGILSQQGGVGLISGLILVSLVLGVILSETLLKKFLASMDVELKHPALRVASAIPMIVGSFVFLACMWAFFTPGLRDVAMPLLRHLLLAFVVSVTIIVVAVPEGLPMMVTVSLALNMRKMATQKCLVRRLIASETIGSATVICTDKTGTLTENKMTPVWFFMDMKTFQGDDLAQVTKCAEWADVERNIAVNSGAQLEQKEGKWVGVGNPTECALIQFLHSQKIDFQGLRQRFPKVWQLGYNSERKRSVAVIQLEGQDVAYIKGAPERILAGCSLVSIGGQVEPIEKYRAAIEAGIMEASNQALRVIAFSQTKPTACADAKAREELENGERIFMGMVGIADPLRKEVPDAVKRCATAGIDVKMITGDALPTARAIATGAGILKPGGLILTSKEFNEISDADLPAKAQELQVLARSTPMDKYRLVQALHKMGDVVAMTGDGTNDAPALKAADVGLSMGITGTEVAKEASDIVLVDDNFTSILTGVWWGRTLYQNIQRFIQFQLSVNVVALLAAFLGPLVGYDLPLTVPQLLWVNIIMDTFAALALSTDPPRESTMHQKPISREAHIITPAMAINMGVVGVFQLCVLYWILMTDSFVEGDANTNLIKQTVFFTTFVMFQFWNIFNCRTLRHDEWPWTKLFENYSFLGIVAVIFVGQVLLVSIGGPIGEIFRTTRISWEEWLKILALTFSVVPVSYLARLIAYWTGCETKLVEAPSET